MRVNAKETKPKLTQRKQPPFPPSTDRTKVIEAVLEDANAGYESIRQLSAVICAGIIC